MLDFGQRGTPDRVRLRSYRGEPRQMLRFQTRCAGQAQPRARVGVGPVAGDVCVGGESHQGQEDTRTVSPRIGAGGKRAVSDV